MSYGPISPQTYKLELSFPHSLTLLTKNAVLVLYLEMYGKGD